MITVNCPQCRKDFRTYPYRLKQSEKVYCSAVCSHASKRITLEEKKSRRVARGKQYRETHQEQRKEWYKKKKEHISELSHKNYIKNKDAYLQRANEQYKKRKVDYHKDEKKNLWENIKVVRWRKAKAEKDPEWKRRQNETRLRRLDEVKAEAIENGAAFKGREWTDGEVAFIEKNHKTMTTLQMALKLDRTYDGVRSALNRYKIGRKVRILKDLLDKERGEVVVK